MGAEKVNAGSHTGNILRFLSKLMGKEKKGKEKRD